MPRREDHKVHKDMWGHWGRGEKTLLTRMLFYIISYQSIYERYEAYSETKYHFDVKKSSKVSHKILLLKHSTFFKLFFHIFTAIIEALSIAGHKFLYTLLMECGRLRC